MTETVAPRQHRLAWIVWALGAMSFGYAFFQRVAPSVMVEDLMRDFAVTGAVLGNLSALYFYAYAGLQIPIGMALDYWGPRRMLTFAMLIAGTGSVIFAGAEALELAYLGRLMIGIGSAVGFVGSLKIATHWFPPNRFAFVSGMSMLVAMAGGMMGQAPLAAIVGEVGWRAALFGAGVFAVALALATWVVVRDDPPGVVPSKPQVSGRGVWQDLKEVVGRRQNWLIAIYSGLMSGPMLSYAGLWGVPHLMQLYELDRPAAAAMTSLMLFGWMVGAPSAGWLSDRVGRRRWPMAAAAGITLGCWILIFYAGGLPLEIAGAVLFLAGMSAAGMVVSYAAAREHSPTKISGAVTGFVNMCSVGAGALLQPLIGWLLDRNWDGTEIDGARLYSLDAYATAFITLPACALTAILLTLLIRETYGRPQVE